MEEHFRQLEVDYNGKIPKKDVIPIEFFKQLVNDVKSHLTSDWVDIEKNINDNGLVK